MMLRKRLNTLLVKPSGANCNLNCDYCFYLEKENLFRGQTFRMSDDILKEIITQAMEQSGQEINFLWQGGEPTLMGLDFFKKIVVLQKEFGKGKIIANGFQTNGVLLNNEWARFLYEQKFLVGLSLDGPKHIHDFYRKNKNGKGSWVGVYNNYFELKKNKVEVNILATVNNYSAHYPREIYSFFKNMNVDFIQFIPIFEKEGDKLEPFSVLPEDYGNFLVKIWELWLADFNRGKAPNIRTFEAIFANYLGLPSSECTFANECGNYLVVEHNGDVFSCDYFVQPETKLGNIQTHSLDEMLNSAKQKEFGLRKRKKNSDCSACKYYKFCYGGCPKYRFSKNGESFNYHCNAYKIFFDKAHSFFLKMSEEWKIKNIREKK